MILARWPSKQGHYYYPRYDDYYYDSSDDDPRGGATVHDCDPEYRYYYPPCGKSDGASSIN